MGELEQIYYQLSRQLSGNSLGLPLHPLTLLPLHPGTPDDKPKGKKHTPVSSSPSGDKPKGKKHTPVRIDGLPAKGGAYS